MKRQPVTYRLVDKYKTYRYPPLTVTMHNAFRLGLPEAYFYRWWENRLSDDRIYTLSDPTWLRHLWKIVLSVMSLLISDQHSIYKELCISLKYIQWIELIVTL